MVNRLHNNAEYSSFRGFCFLFIILLMLLQCGCAAGSGGASTQTAPPLQQFSVPENTESVQQASNGAVQGKRAYVYDTDEYMSTRWAEMLAAYAGEHDKLDTSLLEQTGDNEWAYRLDDNVSVTISVNPQNSQQYEFTIAYNDSEAVKRTARGPRSILDYDVYYIDINEDASPDILITGMTDAAGTPVLPYWIFAYDVKNMAEIPVVDNSSGWTRLTGLQERQLDALLTEEFYKAFPNVSKDDLSFWIIRPYVDRDGYIYYRTSIIANVYEVVGSALLYMSFDEESGAYEVADIMYMPHDIYYKDDGGYASEASKASDAYLPIRRTIVLSERMSEESRLQPEQAGDNEWTYRPDDNVSVRVDSDTRGGNEARYTINYNGSDIASVTKPGDNHLNSEIYYSDINNDNFRDVIIIGEGVKNGSQLPYWIFAYDVKNIAEIEIVDENEGADCLTGLQERQLDALLTEEFYKAFPGAEKEGFSFQITRPYFSEYYGPSFCYRMSVRVTGGTGQSGEALVYMRFDEESKTFKVTDVQYMP